MWLRLYLNDLNDALQPNELLWWTLRRHDRGGGLRRQPMTYEALRAVFRRVNAVLGSNWTMHDLRHTAAVRMSRMHQRVRDRLPRLPALVKAVEDHLAAQTALLTSAAATPIGKTFTHNSRGYQRIIPPTYNRPKYGDTTPPVLVEDLATAERINLSDSLDFRR